MVVFPGYNEENPVEMEEERLKISICYDFHLKTIKLKNICFSTLKEALTHVIKPLIKNCSIQINSTGLFLNYSISI